MDPTNIVTKLNNDTIAKILDEDCLRKASGQSDMGKTTHNTIITTAKKQRENKTRKLLENSDIKRWYDNIARGSPITAETRSRRLIRFCEVHKMTPMELAELGMRDLRAVTDLLQDHITWMEQEDYAPQYIEAMMTALKSWLRHFDIQIKRRLKIADADSTPTLENERVPDADEMSEILSRAALREGAIISLMAKAGLRPEVLGNHDGTDGLLIKDLPDLAITNGIATFRQEPAKIIVRRTLSKARHQYFTFLSDGGAKRVLAYLNDRLAKGEMLNSESAVIAPNKDYNYGRQGRDGNKFLLTVRISNVVRNTFRPRFTWRPYVLRAYFDTQLLIAEARGKIAHDFRVFFMGHKGSIEAKYTTNKGVLAEVLVKEMQEAFKRSEELLDLETTVKDPLQKQKEEFQSLIARAAPEQVQEMLKMMASASPRSESSI
ncbi:MAG: site-specific integrase [Thaumarchaeota archaeon]|nr:site-specific integrase [Nitrososphaerota archaeon]MDE1867034.1 site-specific integrase [Nitrososphaerota archaeon]